MTVPALRDTNTLSPFWRTQDLKVGEPCMVRRLGPSLSGEFRAKILGHHDCDVDGHPWSYIIQLVDKIPGDDREVIVLTRACVDSVRDIDALPNERLLGC